MASARHPITVIVMSPAFFLFVSFSFTAFPSMAYVTVFFNLFRLFWLFASSTALALFLSKSSKLLTSNFFILICHIFLILSFFRKKKAVSHTAFPISTIYNPFIYASAFILYPIKSHCRKQFLLQIPKITRVLKNLSGFSGQLIEAAYISGYSSHPATALDLHWLFPEAFSKCLRLNITVDRKGEENNELWSDQRKRNQEKQIFSKARISAIT